MSAQRDDVPRVVDHAFANVLARREPDADPRVIDAAARASFAIAQGHAALDLDGDAQLREALALSRWVARPDADAVADPAMPLVLEGDLLYLRRYREYERRLAMGLRRIASAEIEGADIATPAAVFERLFPAATRDEHQARAAALALRHALLLITGGPGTGKTTTIARMLLLAVAQAQASGRTLRIALAAPTGRAADRMAQSLRIAVERLREDGLDDALCDALPANATTLHRLLGTIHDRPQFRHGADLPLAHEMIVVDEASMVDLPMMCKLVEAVPRGARLVLLGDRDQLPSVEAGDVLAAIADAATMVDAATPEPIETPHRFKALRVALQRTYRQADAFDLAPLAAAVRDGDADSALRLLRDGSLRNVHFHEDAIDPLAASLRDTLLAPWRALGELAADAPQAIDDALARAQRARLLTALRNGAQGATALNARIEEALAGAQRDPYFHGRLVAITENSYRHGLFNGDLGLCLRGEDGSVVWFRTAAGLRPFHPAALPAHAGAFAMTVHKAQGSEFDTVWLQLPRQFARTLSRELIYTAITRARDALHVCASESVLRDALSVRAQRVSGLARRLREA
ncbi:Exodeoxyribonuclease V alpha chain [Lysobacter dokdonensis DS-58]|uniref:RecBCD enzyme subunit RecD n=1 Tax=Lysobacter dokdonensis DS-58 TaxID=1300345 RepID=A0A0A2WDS1_9GAMM|nr:exodeoxyribonuclease V subunit alpha [Lysobacter dokdonensis]KGQ18356.1 Exodeoxyribonuclease V alpha chain [Lysobacter dokdonensis DS-58]